MKRTKSTSVPCSNPDCENGRCTDDGYGFVNVNGSARLACNLCGRLRGDTSTPKYIRATITRYPPNFYGDPLFRSRMPAIIFETEYQDLVEHCMSLMGFGVHNYTLSHVEKPQSVEGPGRE